MSRVLYKIEGQYDLKQVFKQLEDDFGPKDQSNILKNSTKIAMIPVRDNAKARAPIDTGGLQASIKLTSGKPTSKQKRSKYISNSDVMVATVSTSTVKQLKKIKYTNRKTNQKTIGVKSDARAIAMEFGTATVAKKPYLRPALEANSQSVVNSLGEMLFNSMKKYKSKYRKG